MNLCEDEYLVGRKTLPQVQYEILLLKVQVRVLSTLLKLGDIRSQTPDTRLLQSTEKLTIRQSLKFFTIEESLPLGIGEN